jgi:hypothetical protein
LSSVTFQGQPAQGAVLVYPTIESSSAPNWAFYVTHDAGVTVDGSNNVTALIDQSTYGLTATNISGITRAPATDPLLGVGCFTSLGAGAAHHVRWSNYITPDTRPMLTTGLAYVALMRMTSTSTTAWFVGQGFSTRALDWRLASTVNQYSVLTVAAAGGAAYTLSTVAHTGFEFRYLVVRTGVGLLSGTSGRFLDLKGHSALVSPTQAQLNTNSPLVLFNRWSAANTVGTTSSSAGSLAAFGIVDPTQVEQTRRFWANKYGLTL